MSITLNKNLDTKQLAKAYKGKKRLQIPDFLEASEADQLYEVLTLKTPWQITYNDGKKAIWIDVKEMENKIGRRIREMTNLIFGNATKGDFQYIRYARLLKENQTGMRPLDPVLVEIYDFLNGKDVSGFIKAVTGKSIKEADAEAHWYNNDNFQTVGDGVHLSAKASIGFTLNLAKNWRADWGGITLFTGQDQHIAEVFIPKFNSLEIFEIPTNHFISMVTHYAGDFRISIAGSFSS
jgi:Rps23 Pro-64 3,4-dihydroxylase Tpa1-like proline 4-hydroxylase